MFSFFLPRTPNYYYFSFKITQKIKKNQQTLKLLFLRINFGSILQKPTNNNDFKLRKKENTNKIGGKIT
jgi:hypothetical protein